MFDSIDPSLLAARALQTTAYALLYAGQESGMEPPSDSADWSCSTSGSQPVVLHASHAHAQCGPLHSKQPAGGGPEMS